MGQVLLEDLIKMKPAEQMVDKWQGADEFTVQIERSLGHSAVGSCSVVLIMF
jgi:C4-type Zn-finger protein